MPAFHDLKLNKDQYDRLKKKHKGETLVFQFFYPLSPPDNSPTLRVYAMKKRHRMISISAAEDLEYVSQNIVTLSEIRVQGDLQVNVKEMEKLKKESHSDPEDYVYFLFTPKAGISDHITYEVKVIGIDLDIPRASLDLDPSPPATAT